MLGHFTECWTFYYLKPLIDISCEMLSGRNGLSVRHLHTGMRVVCKGEEGVARRGSVGYLETLVHEPGRGGRCHYRPSHTSSLPPSYSAPPPPYRPPQRTPPIDPSIHRLGRIGMSLLVVYKCSSAAGTPTSFQQSYCAAAELLISDCQCHSGNHIVSLNHLRLL